MEGKTLLHVALQEGKRWEIIQDILNHGADINAKDKFGRTPLFYALENWCVNVEENEMLNDSDKFNLVNKLFNFGALVTESDNSGDTPLHIALRCGKTLKYIQEILRYGADVNAKNLNGDTPIMCACNYFCDNSDVIMELLTHGASVMVKNNARKTTLHFAIQSRKSLEIIKEILKHGVDINAKDNIGKTPLFYVLEMYSENFELFNELLKNGASVSERDELQDTPLHIALRCGKTLEFVQQILRYGADVNAKNIEGETPIFCACDYYHENSDVIMELLKHGASVLEKNTFGNTPLHFALSRDKSIEVIQEFLKHGADVNAKNSSGFMPLSELGSSDLLYSGVLVLLTNYGASIHKSIDLDILEGYVNQGYKFVTDMFIKFAVIEHSDGTDCLFCKNLSEKFRNSFQFYKSEIDTMKNDYIIDTMSLFDIIVQKCDYGKLFSKQDDIFLKCSNFEDHVYCKYPIYFDVVLDRLETRTYLLRHLYDIPVSIVINNKVFNINPCCLQIIGKYLSKNDIKNFIDAFSNFNKN